jgi:hypothetical protein
MSQSCNKTNWKKVNPRNFKTRTGALAVPERSVEETPNQECILAIESQYWKDIVENFG